MPLDVLELVVNVDTPEREDQLESKDLKVLPVPLVLPDLRELLENLETRERVEKVEPKVFKDCQD